MAKIPCEYSGGGTVLSNSGNASAYASTVQLVPLASLTLTKGVWIVIGFVDQNVANPSSPMTAMLTSNNSVARTTGMDGGGLFVEDIVNVTSSMEVTLKCQQYTDTILSGKILRGTIKAYKLND